MGRLPGQQGRDPIKPSVGMSLQYKADHFKLALQGDMSRMGGERIALTGALSGRGAEAPD